LNIIHGTDFIFDNSLIFGVKMNDPVANTNYEAELELLKMEQAELAEKIEACKRAGRDAALEKVKALCKAYEISTFDLRGSLKKPTVQVAKKVYQKRKQKETQEEHN
jgi:hypothetical protein